MLNKVFGKSIITLLLTALINSLLKAVCCNAITVNIKRSIVLTDENNSEEVEVQPTRIDKSEFTSEEYESLLQGKMVGKDGYLYEIQGDGAIMLIGMYE